MPSCQDLGELLDAFLRLSLVCQRPAVQHRTNRPKLRESMFLCEIDCGFGAFLGAMYLPTQLMEHSSTAQGKNEAMRACHLLRQGYRLLAPCERLVRIAQTPQYQSADVVERHALRQVRVRSG